MGHDAFARRGLGSAALVIIGALHARAAQTVAELVGSSSVSRATLYRALRRLADHGLVHHSGETWTLAPHALEGFGDRPPGAAAEEISEPARGWEAVATRHGTAGLAFRRKAVHAAERAAYQRALEQLSEHRSKAVVIVRDGRQSWFPRHAPTRFPPRGTPRTAVSSIRSPAAPLPTGGSRPMDG